MSETAVGKDEFSLSPDEQRLVLDAALELPSQSGLHANVIERVAERCGIPAKRIYVHFGGTEKMIETLLDRELTLIAGSVTLPQLRFPGETLRDELEGLALLSQRHGQGASAAGAISSAVINLQAQGSGDYA